MNKVDTIKYGNVSAYATVPARLKEFREKNPRGEVVTEPMYQPDGSLIFKATIISDNGEESSARATGHARYSATEANKAKAFEKLETVATGRALALLGYLNNGDIATTEEMTEFEDYKSDRKQEARESAIAKLSEAKTLEELKSVWTSLGELMADQLVEDAKNKRKVELNADN